MNLQLIYCRVAVRNLMRNPRRSLLTIGAVAFGLFCLIIFQALKGGLHREMILSTVQLDTGSLQIHAAGYEANRTAFLPIDQPETVLQQIRQTDAIGAAPRLKTPALILAGPNSATVLLAGIEPDLEQKITFINQRLIKGTYLDKPKSIVIGQQLAAGLGVKVGESITLMGQNMVGQPTVGKFLISGLYKTDLASFNRTRVYIQLNDARSFLGTEANEISEIAVKADSKDMGSLASRLAKELPKEHYQVRTWQEIATDVTQMIDLNDATMALLILIVFAIVAMGIANTMTMALYERFHEIGILAAVGTAPAGIVTIVILESLFMGMIASLLGTLAGSAACWYLSLYGIDLSQMTSANQYFAGSHVLKAHLLASDLVMANVVTMLTALLASIYPAIKAARLNPVQALQHY